MHTYLKDFYKKHDNFFIFTGLFIISLCVRSIPFILYGAHPLGYDTGFYRRYLTQPFISFFLSFPNNPVPGLGNDAIFPRLLLDTLRLLNISPDNILYGTYIFFSSTIPLLIYLLLSKKFNKYTAIFASIFFIVSPVQYTGFWFMLWKNYFAINLLLIAFILFDGKKEPAKSSLSFFLLIIIDILLGLSHTTTSIIYLGTLLVFLVLHRNKYKAILPHILATGLTLFVTHPSLYTTNKVTQSVGVFIEWNQYLVFSIPFVLLALSSFKKIVKAYRDSILFAFILLSLFFPIFRLPFYERVFLFTDLSLIFIAGMGCYFIFLEINSGQQNINRKKILYGGLILIAIANLLGNTHKQINALRPLIKRTDLKLIEDSSPLFNSSTTIITSTEEAPWYQGFTEAHLVAPGMLNDINNFERWNDRWNSTSTADQIDFLKNYPRPLYISSTNSINEIIGVPAPCITKINDISWKVNCE